MTHQRRYATSPTKSPARTGGEDRPAPACADRWFIFDVLIDSNAGRLYDAALEEARDMCAGCPLFDACMTANRDEPWARAILGRRPSGRPRSAKCGTYAGYNLHQRNHERACEACKDARLAYQREHRARKQAAA